MKLGPRYKICKRLGSSIFEKCQTRRFALSKERSAANAKRGSRPRAGSDYSRQLIEKQKLRLTYGLSERQFANYVAKALESGSNPQSELFSALESRLDSVAYRMGLAPTRRAARQLVAHGHLVVNGRRITTPSYKVSVNDVVSVREGSRTSTMFASLSEKLKEMKFASWVDFDPSKHEGIMKSAPAFAGQDSAADIGAVFEYYTR